MDDIADMFRKAIEAKMRDGGDDDEERARRDPTLAPDIEAIRLRDALETFTTQHTFKIGDIVRQKRGVRGYRKQNSNDLGIVVEVMETPIMFQDKEQGSGSPYWRQPLDLQVGHCDGDSFMVYHVDSRRYEPVPEEEIRLRVRGMPTTEQ